MKKKITVTTAVTLIILTAALTISITMLAAMRYFNKQVQSVSQRQAMYTHINDVDKKVREYYTDLDEETLRECITEGYVNGIGDSYARYYTSDEYATELLRRAGQINDLGIGVCANAKGDTVVCRVDADSAADKAGVKSGDVLTAIDSTAITGRTAESVQQQLDAASTALLKVQRGESAVAFDLSAFQHTIRSVQDTMLGQVGYVKITAFYENTPDQFKSVVSSLLDQGATGFIFDLRGNRGGLASSVEEVLSYLMPSGMYGTVTDASGTTNLSSSTGTPISVSTVTLIDSTTAGEAEFMAGVLQEFSLTTVVGETSAGKAKFQQCFVLETDGSAIQLTTGEYGLLKGGSWEGKGIVPTQEVKLTDAQKALLPLTAAKDDAQITAALAQIGGSVSLG